MAFFKKNREEEPEAALRKNIKNMTIPQKLEYFWMYDKWVIAVAILVIAVVVGGFKWYQQLKTKTLLTLTIFNGASVEYETVTEEAEEVLGVSGPYEKVNVIASYTADVETGELDYYTQIGYVAQVQAKLLDVLVMPKAVMDQMEEENFIPLDQLLGAEEAGKYSNLTEHNCLVLQDGILAEHYGLLYEPVCIGVVVNSQNQERAAAWVRWVLEQQTAVKRGEE